jgi:RNA polymerase sigma-70 factor (ECF subfamily)
VTIAIADRNALAAAMTRHADGEAGAFVEVYDLLAPPLLRFFATRTRCHATAEDLVQQTLLNMHGARSVYVRSSDVVPWAFAIARRLLIDARRRTKKELLYGDAADEHAALDARRERYAIPDEIVPTEEGATIAARALERMPAIHREAYLLVRHDGLSIAQAAEVLGASPTAVKLRVHRAYEAFRSALAG